MIAANVDEPEVLVRAFEGTYGAYYVTFFWDHFSPERELKQADSLSRGFQIRLQHAIRAMLDDTRKFVPLDDDRMPNLMGKRKFSDVKWEANQSFTDAGVPTTLLLTSSNWDTFINFGMDSQRGADGSLAITFPVGDKKLPGIAGEHLTGTQMASSFSKALGQEVRYNDVPPAVFRSFGFRDAEDLR